MNVAKGLAAVALMLFGGSASADVTVSDYKTAMSQGGPNKELMTRYVVGVARGAIGTNKLATHGGHPLFCPPTAFSLGDPFLAKFIDNGIQGFQVTGAIPDTQSLDGAVVVILLVQFECK